MAKELLQAVFFQGGFSELIFLDRAKEFLGVIMKNLTRLTGSIQIAALVINRRQMVYWKEHMHFKERHLRPALGKKTLPSGPVS